MALFSKSFDAPWHTPGKSDMPAPMPGTHKGEEWVGKIGREPGRDEKRADRVARDSTSVNDSGREPVDLRMPHIPPA